jgi:hypothetical protein
MSERVDATPVTSTEPAKTIGEVIERMAAIDASLPHADGVGHFNRLYLAVTEAVQKCVRDVSFEDEPFLSRLDVVFANLYFNALADWETRHQCSGAWRPLFAAREHIWRRPIQFALCGMNAHINHDLPLAVARTFGELDAKLVSDSPQYRDFMRVNRVLRQVEPNVKSWFVSRLIADVDRATGDEADELAMWSIADARGVAWHHARRLWRLRGHPQLESAYLDTLSGLVELAGRGILL